MENNKNIILAKKLKELAIQGIGGEKENAQKMLSNLMQKHNLREQDLIEDIVDWVNFNVSELEKDIFFLIVSSVNDDAEVFSLREKKNTYSIKLSAYEAMDVQIKSDFYLPKYKEELTVLQIAFAIKNNIIPSKRTDNEEKIELTEAERLRSKRVSKMLKVVEKHRLVRELN